MQASQVLPHRSRQTIFVWISLCARGHCHTETGKGLPQTVATSWKHRIIQNVIAPSFPEPPPQPHLETGGSNGRENRGQGMFPGFRRGSHCIQTALVQCGWMGCERVLDVSAVGCERVDVSEWM